MQVSGMVCYACADILKRALEKTPGVLEAEVNYLMDTVVIRYDDGADKEAARQAARRAGYRLDEMTGEGKSIKELERKRKVRLRRFVLMAFFCSVLLNGFGKAMPAAVQLLLGTLVQGIVVFEFYREAKGALANGRGSMAVLIALAATAGYVYSVFALAVPGGEMRPCFDNLAAAVTMVLIGRFLELGIRGQSADGIRSLINYKNRKARILTGEGEREISVEEVKPRMRIVVRAGERVPVDGVILEGNLCLDESVLTGEYYPVEKGPGERVEGASIVIRGYGVYETDKKPEENIFYRLMEEASSAMRGKKLVAVSLTDRLMTYFVPAVTVTALITLFAWYGFFRPGDLEKAVECALSVLLAACPCAMGLAVPISVISTLGAAADHGIFIREEGKFERLRRTGTVIFDKTGTLTTGELQVKKFELNYPDEKSRILSLLGGIEKRSNHPAAKAIRRFAVQYGDETEPEYFQEYWNGVEGGTPLGKMFVGSKEFVEERIGRKLESAQTAKEGSIYFAVGRTEGFLEIEDTLRKGTKEAVERLIQQGIEPVLLSGDKRKEALRIAEKAGITRVEAECSPERKAEMVKACGGKKGVVLAGDGLNDIPGAAEAETGIALGCGCDALQEMADIVIGKNSLLQLPALVELSRALHQNIRQNLAWAFLYNLTGIIMSISGNLNPALAGFAMSVSSLAVLVNGLRMRKKGNKILERQ